MNIGKVRLEDLVNPQKWKQYGIYLLKKLLKKLDNSTVLLSNYEMIQYGYRAAKCYPCLVNKSCFHCGCNTAGKMSNKTDACSLEYWGPFMTDEEMEKFLENYEFKFDVKIVKKDVQNNSL